VAISTGELGKLIPDLVEALGGPLKLGDAASSTTDKVMAALTGQTAAMGAPSSPYAPANTEDASAPF